MRQMVISLPLGLVFLFLGATCAFGHMFWINSNSYSPKSGETVFVEIGFGHKFPRDQAIKDKQIKEVYALNPSGDRVAVNKIFPAFYTFTPSQEGCYQVIAVMEPGFVSKTPGGHKLGNKKENDNAVSCFHFNMTATALLEVGDSTQDYDTKNKTPLQLLVLTDPDELGTGSTLSVMALFKGKPQAGVKIMSTYAGYKDHWVIEKETNKEGIVEFETDHKGPWYVRAKYNKPYPDKDVCDQYFYSSCLTLDF